MTEIPRKRCVYDPLTALMEHYSIAAPAGVDSGRADARSAEERLEHRIIDGDRIGIEKDLDQALQTWAPIDIINTILLGGMKTVGELFGAGQMQLPFVLQSAETMKTAVAYLEPFMDKVEGIEKATIVLATVKGDVHDIGKNLVDIILTNNGFRVINLGIKVPVETMLHTAQEHRADAIGMSGLLVKSTVIMKENLELMQNRGLRIPVILGGAALTRRYVENELRSVYGGDVAYAQDAFAGLRFMEHLATIKRGIPDEFAPERIEEIAEEALPTDVTVEEEPALPAGAALETSRTLQTIQEERADLPHPVERATGGHTPYRIRASVAADAPVPVPPFWGSKVVDSIQLDKIFEYVNPRALIRGQWQIKRGKLGAEEYEALLERDVYPALESLKLAVKRENIFSPAVVYGFFPCNADGNELIVYKPRNASGDALYRVWSEATSSPGELEEWQRFLFPRQNHGKYLCISDFFRSVDSGAVDVCAFQIVTIGANASIHTAELFRQNKYQDYLYLHGLSVETAEALAEYWHKSVRTELGIAARDAASIDRLFSQGYQGSRYSFGYPACPNLEDHRQLFALLRPERIGITLTEEFQLVPEQSTSAIIVHHPEAKYFNVR